MSHYKKTGMMDVKWKATTSAPFKTPHHHCWLTLSETWPPALFTDTPHLQDIWSSNWDHASILFAIKSALNSAVVVLYIR